MDGLQLKLRDVMEQIKEKMETVDKLNVKHSQLEIKYGKLKNNLQICLNDNSELQDTKERLEDVVYDMLNVLMDARQYLELGHANLQ